MRMTLAISALLAGLCASAGPALAQGGPPPGVGGADGDTVTVGLGWAWR